MKTFLILILLFLFSCKEKQSLFIGKWESNRVPGSFKRMGITSMNVMIYTDRSILIQFIDNDKNEVMGFNSTLVSKTDSIVYLVHETAYTFSLPNGTELKIRPDSTLFIRGMTLHRNTDFKDFAKPPITSLNVPKVNKRNDKIIIKNVQIIDAIKNQTSDKIDVYIENGNIKNIAKEIQPTVNVKVINADGKFLSPSLWDMHAHYKHINSPELTMPLFIASGVTNIRLMKTEFSGLNKSKIEDWKSAVKQRRILGPTIVDYTSFRIHGPKGKESLNPDFFSPKDKEEAVKLVRFLKKNNYPSIKMYGKSMTAEVYQTILDEANKVNLRVVGHKPSTVTALASIISGQRSFEHGHFLIQAGFVNEEESVHSLNEFYNKRIKKKVRFEHHDLIQQQSLEKLDLVIKTMIEKNTYLVPTLITRKFDAYSGNTQFRNDDRLKYIYPRLLRNKWLREIKSTAKAKKLKSGYYQSYYDLTKRYTYRAYKAGVNILAGTDANDSFCFPGSSIVDELEAMVEAGFKPAEALQTSTINPAKFLSLEKTHGSVSIGKAANLLILNKNPLKNISNLRNIDYLIFQESIYTKNDLSNLLKTVADNVNKLN